MSNERVFFLSKPPPPEELPQDFHEAMAQTSGNTGNVLFMTALQKQLSYTKGGFGNRLSDPEMVSRNYDYVAIAAANWLAPRTVLTGHLADLLERTRLPCIVAGIGAQALNTRSIPPLNEGTLRFLKIVSERSKVIGVRGEYTQRVMAHYGIKNAEVIGCPSYFWSLKPQIEIEKRPKANLVVAVNASRKRVVDRTIDRIKRSIERELYRYAFNHDGSFIVAQTEEFEIDMSLGTPLREIPKPQIESFRDFYDAKMHVAKLEDLREKFRVFNNVKSWIDEVSRADFVIGTRLHGCLIGILAGKPTLMISIDSRTKELAEYLKIPTIETKDLRLPLDVEELYAQVDIDRLVRGYPERFNRYKEFLEANGVNHNLSGPQAVARASS